MGIDVKKSACFGKLWEGIGNNVCIVQCDAEKECLHHFAMEYLPQAQTQLKGASLESLEIALGVKSEALLIAMNYKQEQDELKNRRVPIKIDKKDNIEKVDKIEPMAKIDKSDFTVPSELLNSKWHKERNKYPELSILKEGDILTRNFKGQKYQIEVVENGYKFNTQVFPTLRNVTHQIASKGFTGPQFWAKEIDRLTNERKEQ